MTLLLYSILGLLLAPVYQQAPRPKLDVPPSAQAAGMPPGRPQVVGSLSFTGGELLTAFNATADRVRLVLVLSPT